MLHDVVIIECMHTQSMPLTMLTMKKELKGVLFLCMHVVLFLWSSWGFTWQWLLELCYKGRCIINVFTKME